VTELRILTDLSAWRTAHRERLCAAYRRSGLSPATAEKLAAQWLARRAESGTDPAVAEILADGTPVGVVAVALPAGPDDLTATVEELWVHPAHADGGHGQAALHWAEELAGSAGATAVSVRLVDPSPLFDGYQVRGQLRFRAVDTAAELPDGVTARPMTEAEYPGWLAAEQEEYVFDIVRAGAHTREQAQQKSDEDFARILPQGRDTPGHGFLVLEAKGATIGTGWLHHGFLPGVTFGYSLFIEPEQRGNGYGRAAMALGEQATLAAGDSALMFNVFGGNEVAMSLYTSAGYRVLTENRSRDLG